MQQASCEGTIIWDVAIVGCGPVGAFAANLLGAAGLNVVVLEREVGLYPLPRAVHLDHEMMRLIADVGLLEAMAPLMAATDGHVHVGADGDVIRYLGSVGQPRPFHFANDYFFYQPELEAVLRQGIARFDCVDLRTGVEVAAIEQQDDHACLTLTSGDTIQARYVIGCDGARSAVRKMSGIVLDDLDFEEPWLVVDAEVDGPLSFPAIGGLAAGVDLGRFSVMHCDPARPTTVVPGRGNHRRWEFMLLPGEDDAAMMQPDAVARLIAPWVRDLEHRVVRAATYRFHGLVAKTWRDGRMLLAGDAAHQTPPFFGQGMCHGFRDVANLAWKLAAILQVGATDGLLASYQSERDPHVRAVIAAALEAGRYICELDPAAAAARDRRMRAPAPASSARTAADLIPPLGAGFLAGPPDAASGIGVRFIQPDVARADGDAMSLDAATGGGWRLFVLAGAEISSASASAFAAIGGSIWRIGSDIVDVRGDLIAWLHRHDAAAVIVRPDFYTYGTSASDGADALIDGIAGRLSNVIPVEVVAA